MHVGVRASEEARVPRAGENNRVVVTAVHEVGSAEKSFEPTLNHLGPKPLQVIVSELVDYEDHDELWLSSSPWALPRCRCSRRHEGTETEKNSDQQAGKRRDSVLDHATSMGMQGSNGRVYQIASQLIAQMAQTRNGRQTASLRRAASRKPFPPVWAMN